MKWVGIAWRFMIDDCPGGQKFTGFAVKFCALVLVGGVVCIGYFGPTIITEVLKAKTTVDRFGELLDLKDSITVLTQTIALQNVQGRADRAEDVRRLDDHAKQILGLNTVFGSTEKDVIRLQGDVGRLQGDVKYLNENTVKTGRR